MPQSIVPLLAERLDISEDRARSLMDTMVEELRQRAESDGVQLSGLGIFQEEDGNLIFQPSPALRRRVNHPYEGLSAESLSAGSATSESTDSETPPFLTPKSSGEDDATEEATTSESSSTPAADHEADSGQDRPPSRPDASTRSADSFTIISLVLTVLFLLGAGWFVLDRTNMWGPTQDAPPPTATETPPDQDTGDAPAESVPDSQADTSSAARDWTIVVASSSSRDAAQEAADAYAPQFDSVTVVPGTVDNTTWYRVTIGRYASEAAAERVLSDQADALPSDAWTHQFE